MRYLIVFLALMFSLNTQAFEIRVADKMTYDVVKADTREKLERGLMFVKEMPENKGMWFDFRAYGKPDMWMKNTFIPLDMLFIGCDLKVKDIYENAEPLSLKRISTDEDFCYVVEVNGGESAKRGLQIGDKVSIIFKNKTM